MLYYVHSLPSGYILTFGMNMQPSTTVDAVDIPKPKVPPFTLT